MPSSITWKRRTPRTSEQAHPSMDPHQAVRASYAVLFQAGTDARSGDWTLRASVCVWTSPLRGPTHVKHLPLIQAPAICPHRLHPQKPLHAHMLSIVRPTLSRGQQSLSLGRVPELPDPLQGDVHPVGTVVELIVQFVDGLFQQVGIQEHLTLVPSRGQQGCWHRRRRDKSVRMQPRPRVPHLCPGL